jgi:hypothetical protein
VAADGDCASYVTPRAVVVRRGSCREEVSEIGVSSFGAEEVQEFGLRRTAELLIDRVARIHWYSPYDLPKTWPATTRRREAQGSAYYRHFYMGLLRENVAPKLAFKQFTDYTPAQGECWRQDCGVKCGISSCNSIRVSRANRQSKNYRSKENGEV